MTMDDDQTQKAGQAYMFQGSQRTATVAEGQCRDFMLSYDFKAIRSVSILPPEKAVRGVGQVATGQVARRMGFLYNKRPRQNAPLSLKI